MEDLELYRIRMDGFIVHLDARQNWLKFEVYPVEGWTHVLTGEEGISYIDKENEPCERKEFEEDKCLKKLKGSVCWRGVGGNTLLH